MMSSFIVLHPLQLPVGRGDGKARGARDSVRRGPRELGEGVHLIRHAASGRRSRLNAEAAQRACAAPAGSSSCC
jgi:hypothetical protein